MNNKAQKNIIGAILICFLLVAVTVTASFIAPISTKADEGYETQASVSDFLYYKSITLDHNQVPGDLHDFVVPINISSDADLASDALNSGWDIAFFDDGDAQLAHELEYFDGSTGELIAWVKIPLLSSSGDTTIYMYYGDSDIGAPTSDAGNTWSSNFTAVYHFRNLTDSAGSYDLTNNGNNVNLNDSDGWFGGCADFGTADDRYLTQATLLDTVGTAFSITFLMYPLTLGADGEDAAAGDDYIIHKDQDNNPYHQVLFFYNDLPDRDYRVRLKTGDGDYNDYSGFQDDLLATEWSYFGLTYEDNEASTHMADTNFTQTAETCAVFSDGTETDFYIGARATVEKYYDGRIDEFRVYAVNLSHNWLLTEHNSYMNATDGGFFTLGPEQGGGGEEASVYTLNGLTSDLVTWAGISGNSVWCNETGDGNEYLEINMSINASQNVTDIKVFMDDLNDTDAWINASNITIYVSSDNSSYGVPTHDLGNGNGVYVDGGGNITINATTWNAGTMGANPFTAGEGLTNKTKSIYCIFLLSIPAGLSADTFFSAASDSYKIYIGNTS